MPCSILIKHLVVLTAKYKKSISNSSLYDFIHVVKCTAQEILDSKIILGHINVFSKVKKRNLESCCIINCGCNENNETVSSNTGDISHRGL